MPLLIGNRQARRLLLHLQGLSGPPHRRLTKEGLLELIASMGYVQVDSINTVERAHHQILFARNQTYRKKHLKALLERDRALFENWTHDAAIIPSRFFPYWAQRFLQEEEKLRARWREWRRDGFEEALDDVLDRIAQNGPTLSRELAEGNGTGSTGWWDWHPAKTALEYHWRTGRLAVARREGFQKVYDLTERVIPAAHRGETPRREVSIDWACRAALQRLGIATSGEIADFWGGVTAAEAKAWCAAAPGRGEAVDVLVQSTDGAKPRAAYARPDIEDLLRDLPPPPGRLRALSPFDPLLRNRNRTERLFGFRYRIEVFVPEAKRRYGYYVFPLLEGDRLIGRIDMKCERDCGNLAVKGLWLEPRVKFTKSRRDALDAELERQRRFAGAERVSYAKDFLKNTG